MSLIAAAQLAFGGYFAALGVYRAWWRRSSVPFMAVAAAFWFEAVVRVVL